MSFVPTRQFLEFLFPGEPVVDRFGNERPGVGVWEVVEVASWWIDRTDEKADESILRIIDMLHVHVPAENAPDAAGRVRTPDGAEWEIEGNFEDFTHGWHGWNPGLLVIHAKRVEG